MRGNLFTVHPSEVETKIINFYFVHDESPND